MCHFLLGLPLLALPVFWLLPFAAALPVYVTASAVSLVVYVHATRAMRTPRMNGAEALIGATGRIVGLGNRTATLRLHGEMWSVDAQSGQFAIGDEAIVTGIDGLRLRARRRGAGS